MTYRELLRKEHPDKVSTSYAGGCYGCPGNYWANAPKAPRGCNAVHGNCIECWSLPMRVESPKKPSSLMDVLKPHLGRHVGHDIIFTYCGDFDNPSDIRVECEDCHEVLISAKAFDKGEVQ